MPVRYRTMPLLDGLISFYHHQVDDKPDEPSALPEPRKSCRVARAGNPIPVLVATVLCVWLGFGAPAPAVDSPASTAEVRFDFETGDLQPWRVVEGEFENPVSSREVLP